MTAREHANMFLELGKVRIASLATLTMITGYILAAGAVTFQLLGLTVGVFLLASGAAALNQIQERGMDGSMQRTMGRPLPSGRVSLWYAWAVVVLALTAGALLIAAVSNAGAMILGLVAVFWYNGVYTPLKKLSAFAAVPGGMVGAIPPAIGWVAAGGSLLDPRIMALSFFFFMWQIPHFWLLLLFSCGKDYEKAGLPSLTAIFTLEQLGRITFMWILATVVTGVLISLFGIVTNPFINIGLFAAGLWLVWRSVRILRVPNGVFSFRLAFKHINLYVCLVISLLSLGAFVG